MAAHEDRIATDEAAYAAALRLGVFSYAALAAEAGIPLERATDLVRGWVACARAQALGKGAHRRLQFQIVVDGTPVLARPEQTTLGNLWRVMRGLASFTPTDLAAHASTDSVRVSRADAAAYAQTLVRAGYLRVLRKAVPERREAVYKLIRNTGPRPPRERRVRAIWDDNLGQFTHLPEIGA